MARKTIVTEQLTDDLDGTTAARTVSFGWEGTNYEIELSNKNYQAMEKILRPYVYAARKVRPAPGVKAAKSGPDLTAVREWAAANDIEVSNRGRVAQQVIDAYLAAQ